MLAASNSTNKSINNDNGNNPNNPSANVQRELCKDCNGADFSNCPLCGGSGRDPNNPSEKCPGGQKACDYGIIHCYTCG